ncbi:MAG: hypothetical protein JWM28_1884 [Chitinophagaceae bacterium]|nr:hypothetical protein [Chitinophagaceae bacterium]
MPESFVQYYLFNFLAIPARFTMGQDLNSGLYKFFNFLIPIRFLACSFYSSVKRI